MRDSMTPKERVRPSCRASRWTRPLRAPHPEPRRARARLHAARVRRRRRIMADAHVAAFAATGTTSSASSPTRPSWPRPWVRGCTSRRTTCRASSAGRRRAEGRRPPGVRDARTAGRLPVLAGGCAPLRGHGRRRGVHRLLLPCALLDRRGAAGDGAFARDLYKHPAQAYVLLDKSLQLVQDFAEAVAEAGGMPVLVDPVASGSVISPAPSASSRCPG